MWDGEQLTKPPIWSEGGHPPPTGNEGTGQGLDANIQGCPDQVQDPL